ncbi:MAG: alpha/beta hydrolase [Gemmatimonadaceae bacterium]|nr:alpha/beta hydrolase [Gemmatimonadaceae bacterium]
MASRGASPNGVSPIGVSTVGVLTAVAATLLLTAPMLRAQADPVVKQAPVREVPGPPLARTGSFKRYTEFPSSLISARTVDVWLPPGYATSRDRYPVLYVHDGQNAFDPATSFGGIDWGIDETMTRLLAEERIRPAIVVAIANSPLRFQEYMPRRALTADSVLMTGVPGVAPLPGPVISDAYLRFLSTELKPFIDRTFRTKREREHTMLMGSSMGGLISLYAISELPGVFGAAACLSTHWPAGDGATLAYLATHVPRSGTHRLYFDHGTATLDSLYGPYQEQADAILRRAGYRDGRNFSTRLFEGAEHSERAWRVRVEQPLVFLLKR